MAYRIKADEGVRHALRRLARAQFEHALSALTGERQSRSARVHELRKSIKRVRALIAVVRPAVGASAARVDREARKIAKTVAVLRDGDVSLTTLDGLLPALGAARAGIPLRRARGRLAARLRDAGGAFEDARRIKRLTARLRRARQRTAQLIPASKARAALREGLFAGYRRARRAQKRAYVKNTARAFHRWRQSVKVHRYQMQLIEELWPGEATAHVESLERLGELLGAEHDLTVLEEAIAADGCCPPDDEGCARLFALINERRLALRAEARPLGDRLFAERPRAFRGRLRDELRAPRCAPAVSRSDERAGAGNAR
ncbi:MAG: CHAD domain-containing protein [Bacteroidota bacterium]